MTFQALRQSRRENGVEIRRNKNGMTLTYVDRTVKSCHWLIGEKTLFETVRKKAVPGFRGELRSPVSLKKRMSLLFAHFITFLPGCKLTLQIVRDTPDET